MARPLNTGMDAVHHDALALSKAMRRIEGDTQYDAKVKAKMLGHLKVVMTWLLTGTDDTEKRAKPKK